MTTTEVSTTDKRTEMVDGLRAFADFLDQHPEFPTPSIYSALVTYARDRDEFTSLASMLGGQRDKRAGDEFFGVVRSFGPLKVEVFTTRDQVCERKVVGTETVEIPDPDAPLVTVERDVVEWVCTDSILDQPTVNQTGVTEAQRILHEAEAVR